MHDEGKLWSGPVRNPHQGPNHGPVPIGSSKITLDARGKRKISSVIHGSTHGWKIVKSEVSIGILNERCLLKMGTLTFLVPLYLNTKGLTELPQIRKLVLRSKSLLKISDDRSITASNHQIVDIHGDRGIITSAIITPNIQARLIIATALKALGDHKVMELKILDPIGNCFRPYSVFFSF